ncbi:hypothetical protein CCMA1212_006826 [Trichoderma ghanense]|uniref:Uncharacterized protein n=1 Tax=Trichoderma ghanense TaxID=65468 RepID=A0ABY2H0U6_9HYPO
MQSLASTAPFCPRQGQSASSPAAAVTSIVNLASSSPRRTWQPDAARLPSLFVPPTLARCSDKRRIAAPPDIRYHWPLPVSHDNASVRYTRSLASTAGQTTNFRLRLRDRETPAGRVYIWRR